MTARATDARTLHAFLLRPAILQILRAAGFHAARPSVVDTLTSICAAYIHLLSCRIHAHALSNHNTLPPDITDVRMGMVDVGALAPSLTSSEEAWREILGQLGPNVYGGGADVVEEVKQFADWLQGKAVKEQKRVAGFTGDDGGDIELEGQDTREDYVIALKKKHSKTGEESRFQGTVLGKDAEIRPLAIDGGPASLYEWRESVKRKAAELATVQENPAKNGDGLSSPSTFMEIELAENVNIGE